MRTLSGGYNRMFFAALIVFFISIATVMGPTPPGTGVIKPAFFFTAVNRKKKKWILRYNRCEWHRKTNMVFIVKPYPQNPHLRQVCSFRWLDPALCLYPHQSLLLPPWSCLQLWGLGSLMFSRHILESEQPRDKPTFLMPRRHKMSYLFNHI